MPDEAEFVGGPLDGSRTSILIYEFHAPVREDPKINYARAVPTVREPRVHVYRLVKGRYLYEGIR